MSIDYCRVSKDLIGILSDVFHDVDCDHCDHHDGEGMVLNAGNHAIEIRTGFHPREVYVSVDSDGFPVCSGSVSKVGTTLTATGFILYADIQTDHAVVKWFVLK